MQKQSLFKIKGMQRDLSASAFSPEYAYENKNIRIMPTDENTLLSIINEKGNKLANAEGVGNTIKVTPLGQVLLNDELVIFSTGDLVLKQDYDIVASPQEITNIPSTDIDINIVNDLDDRVYKFWFDNGKLKGKTMFAGNLNFNYSKPIEAISFYENDSIKKVYWTDGYNQPRVINIAASDLILNKWDEYSFDFTRKLKLNEKITITRDIVSGGVFAPGVLQYAFTYFDKYGQESNIFHTSPMYYVSYNNRGASPESKVGNSFTINIDRADSAFDYIRVYSIHRTSIDSTPTVKRVVDLPPVSGSVAYKAKSYTIVTTEQDVEIFNMDQGKYVGLTTLPPLGVVGDDTFWVISGNDYKYVRFYNGDYIYIEPTKSILTKINNISKEFQASYGVDPTLLTIYKYSSGRTTYTDNNTTGDIIDPTELLYKGGEEAVFGTMSQKDNTLFLGDITLTREILSNDIRDFFKGKTITFSNDNVSAKHLTSPNPVGLYPFDNQLKYNSSQIKTFKFLETYRLGVQFQHSTGKWSEPIWINDVRNDTSPIQASYVKHDDVIMPVAKFTLEDTSIIESLVAKGYVRIRPVVVYPSMSDRECVCQGVLCPTVFNLSDRHSNSPFVQSSWFTRPNAPFDIPKSFQYRNVDGKWYADVLDRNNPVEGTSSLYSRAGTLVNGYKELIGYDITNQEIVDLFADTVNRGTWAEWRHNYPIPSNQERNSEIQCIYNATAIPPVNILDYYSLSTINSWVSGNAENFYIDQSIFTMHSPDIEFDNSVRSVDTSGLKLRIIGIVPLTASASDVDIQTSTPPNSYKGSSVIAPGLYKEPINSNNISRFGWRGISSGAFWFDEISDPVDSYTNNQNLPTAFVVYPFHRNGSLNNTRYAKDGIKTAMLDRKKMSTIRYSYNTYYLNPSKVWIAESPDENNKDTNTGISGISIFDSNEVSLTKIPSPVNSGLDDINYYGNVDKIISYSRDTGKSEGYVIQVAGMRGLTSLTHMQFKGDYYSVQNNVLVPGKNTDTYMSNDPVVMRYKTTPHAVMALNYTTEHSQRILPTLREGNLTTSPVGSWASNHVGRSLADGTCFYWDKQKWTKGVSQDILDIQFGTITNNSHDGYGPEYGFLWLGELYNDNVINRFGGTTEEAIENNMWIPCGEAVSMIDSNSKIKESIPITWVEGDTYYQRYDHIKTYPFTLEEQNGITDIVSFMCETRINLDGRYDRNRGQVTNFTVNPTNFNLLNPVYSQNNTFFVYRAINPTKLNPNNFANSVTWTKTKTPGELVDIWTNTTLASTIDLDGDKGRIRAIRRLNNELITFQDRGIASILFNSRTQIPSSEGVPIEIANSGKVDGKRYISDRIGCANKWSICETPSGIYFIDDTTKGIFLFNGQLDNISDRLGFHSWINSRSTSINQWNPIDFKGFVTYYDKVNGDVFFITKDECLAYSEPLGQFASFYSYESMAYMINLEDRALQFSTSKGESDYKIWLHNEGDYNMYFGRFSPFYTTIIANQEPTVDKTFDILEFRSDTWSGSNLLSNVTFDTLYTWNEYQSGKSYLIDSKGRSSSLKKKFRTWRANIPRDVSNNRDRMRNPWLFIKLATERVNTNKTLLHDMVVDYFN